MANENRQALRIPRRNVLKLAAGGAIGLAVTSLIEGAGAPAFPLAATEVNAASWCWCVDYVKNAYGLSGPVTDGKAENMAGDYLTSRGFRKVNAPAPWCIVVFSSKYPGVDSSSGHVALAAGWYGTNTGWKLTVRGANQWQPNSGNVWTEQGCTNVSDWTLANPVPYSSQLVTYWVR